jgi:hypothetical protein
MNEIGRRNTKNGNSFGVWELIKDSALYSPGGANCHFRMLSFDWLYNLL